MGAIVIVWWGEVVVVVSRVRNGCEEVGAREPSEEELGMGVF
jgi:hypothetical protein